MTRLRFWWQRRRAGMPVRLGEHPSGVSTYSAIAYLSPDLSHRLRRHRDEALRSIADDAL